METSQTSADLLQTDEATADCGCPCGRHWLPVEEVRKLEVAKRYIKKWSEPCCFLRCFRLPDNCYGRHCIHSIYFLCGVLLSISLVAAVYVWFVMCARCVRIWNFGSASCLVEHVSVNETWFCGCRQGGVPGEVCVRNFTCVNVIARYQTRERENVTSQLYETAEDLYWAPPQDPHCSFRHTCTDIDARKRHIHSALETWAFPNSTVPCRYDPLAPHNPVFISAGKYTKTVLIFGLVNVAIVVTCAVAILVTFTTCGWRYIWSRHAPPGVKEEALQWRHQVDDGGGGETTPSVAHENYQSMAESKSIAMATSASADVALVEAGHGSVVT